MSLPQEALALRLGTELETPVELWLHDEFENAVDEAKLVVKQKFECAEFDGKRPARPLINGTERTNSVPPLIVLADIHSTRVTNTSQYTCTVHTSTTDPTQG